MTEHLIVTDDKSMRVIRLRRPEKKNAITQDMYRPAYRNVMSASMTADGKITGVFSINNRNKAAHHNTRTHLVQ